MTRALVRFVAIGGYDRGLALATQAFVALIPMLIVVSAMVPAGSRAALESWLVRQSGLSGASATTVQDLVRNPSEDTAPVTVLGVALLVLSVVGFVRSLQRAYVAAWDLPGMGIAGFGFGLLGATALVAEVVLLLLLAPVAGAVPHVVLLTALLRTVPAILLWWPVQRLLLGGRVGWRALLPGAVVSGAGQTLVMAIAALYLQGQIEHQAERFGVIGVAFVLVSWLVVLGVLLVAGAVLGAELATGARQSVEEPARAADAVP